MKYISVASGSSGNCHFIKEKTTKILVDVGVSGKKVINGLKSHDIDLQGARAILITHEHLDHIKGAGVISRKYNIPIYATEKTLLEMKDVIGKIPDENIIPIEKNKKFFIDDLEISACSISHDAVDPVMYKIGNSKKDIAIITDLGFVSEEIERLAIKSDTVILESNHDKNMLEVGPYTYELKKRVASNVGHLSNDMAGDFCSKLIKSGTKKIFLAHLSRQNNMPLLAYQSVLSILKLNKIKESDFYLSVLEPFEPSELVIV